MVQQDKEELEAFAEAMQRCREREQDALERLEMTVAFMVDNRLATDTAIAQTLGCSRVKMHAMAGRARGRARDLLMKGTG